MHDHWTFLRFVKHTHRFSGWLLLTLRMVNYYMNSNFTEEKLRILRLAGDGPMNWQNQCSSGELHLSQGSEIYQDGGVTANLI